MILKPGRMYRCNLGGVWEFADENWGDACDMRLLQAGNANPAMVIDDDETIVGNIRVFNEVTGRHKYRPQDCYMIREIIP